METDRIINVVSPVIEDAIVPYFTKLVNNNIKVELFILDISKYINHFKLVYSNIDITIFKLYIEHTIFNLDKLIYVDDMKTIDSVLDAVDYLVKNDLSNMHYINSIMVPELIEDELYNLVSETIEFIYSKIPTKDNLFIINWDEIITKTTISVVGYDGISLDNIVT